MLKRETKAGAAGVEGAAATLASAAGSGGASASAYEAAMSPAHASKPVTHRKVVSPGFWAQGIESECSQ